MSRRIVVVLLMMVTLVVVVVALSTGEFSVPLPDVIGSLVGRDTGFSGTVVTQWRAPRVVAAIVFGAALGVSGALFQILTRNPLGSPDVIGFSTGAYTGALIVLLVLGGGYAGVSAGALAGGLATALIVQRLARRDQLGGLRLILVGIGVSALLAAVNHWLLLRAEVEAAMGAAVWGAGSLNGLRWAQAGPALVVALIGLVCALPLARHVHLLEMGEDLATALGLRTQRVRQLTLVLGVALIAGTTAVAGPIAFVSLAAPQLARRALRSGGIPLGGAALMGSLLLPAADLVGQRVIAPGQIPVGLVTASLGGCYLVWLLLKEVRKA